MNLSIVSGTYNRILPLQNMVLSVRQSIKFNLSYEIVLVDGGSIDGTIEWCKSQPDIKLIEQGQLTGAIKAFNKGAYAASGDYVILANDDIEFIDNSIWLSWLFMQSNPNCGIGCFYQDRDRQHLPNNDTGKWQVEKMPVNLNNTQSMMYYGQVCIVPKWLGAKVGWWCDENEYIDKRQIENISYRGSRKRSKINPLHTYAGDNELSSQVYAAGYKVLPIPDTKIHDSETQDELRAKNNISGGKDPRSVNGHHPDSYSWGRKWRDQITGIVGAKVKDNPIYENPVMSKERIIYLPIYEAGWDIQKEQKRGLREALERVGLVAEYDYVGRFNAVNKNKMMTELTNLIIEMKPTIVLTQLHNGANINQGDIVNLKRRTNAYFVNWNGDYWPDNLLSDEGVELAKSFDLMTSVNLDAVEKYQAMGINAKFWQIGWEPDGRVEQATHNYDIVFLASGYSSKRRQLVDYLRSLNLKLGLYGPGWPPEWLQGQNLYNFREAAGIYKGAKISIGDSQWPESGFVSNRVMQALVAGGSALAHQWFRGMEVLGLVDGHTCIVWRDFDNLGEKIKYYLANEDKRKIIAENGEKLALEQHSFDVRVNELMRMIRPEVQEISTGEWRW